MTDFKKFSMYNENEETTASDNTEPIPEDYYLKYPEEKPGQPAFISREEHEKVVLENARLRQAYDYILASRNNVDKELNEEREEHERILKEVRNKAIDDLGEILLEYVDWGYLDCKWETMREKLESLKV